MEGTGALAIPAEAAGPHTPVPASRPGLRSRGMDGTLGGFSTPTSHITDTPPTEMLHRDARLASMHAQLELIEFGDESEVAVPAESGLIEDELEVARMCFIARSPSNVWSTCGSAAGSCASPAMCPMSPRIQHPSSGGRPIMFSSWSRKRDRSQSCESSSDIGRIGSPSPSRDVTPKVRRSLHRKESVGLSDNIGQLDMSPAATHSYTNGITAEMPTDGQVLCVPELNEAVTVTSQVLPIKVCAFQRDGAEDPHKMVYTLQIPAGMCVAQCHVTTNTISRDAVSLEIDMIPNAIAVGGLSSDQQWHVQRAVAENRLSDYSGMHTFDSGKWQTTEDETPMID